MASFNHHFVNNILLQHMNDIESVIKLFQTNREMANSASNQQFWLHLFKPKNVAVCMNPLPKTNAEWIRSYYRYKSLINKYHMGDIIKINGFHNENDIATLKLPNLSLQSNIHIYYICHDYTRLIIKEKGMITWYSTIPYDDAYDILQKSVELCLNVY
jgi:hypothetical protein